MPTAMWLVALRKSDDVTYSTTVLQNRYFDNFFTYENGLTKSLNFGNLLMTICFFFKSVLNKNC